MTHDIDTERITRLEQKLDELLELMRPLNGLLIRQHEATKRLGLSPNALSRNGKLTKYEQIGSTRTYIEVGELAAIKKRKKRGN